MIAPGTCAKCGKYHRERFPIIKKGEDCRPRYCRECVTKHNLQANS